MTPFPNAPFPILSDIVLGRVHFFVGLKIFQERSTLSATCNDVHQVYSFPCGFSWGQGRAWHRQGPRLDPVLICLQHYVCTVLNMLRHNVSRMKHTGLIRTSDLRALEEELRLELELYRAGYRQSEKVLRRAVSVSQPSGKLQVSGPFKMAAIPSSAAL